jgi:hypothetical protein
VSVLRGTQGCTMQVPFFEGENRHRSRGHVYFSTRYTLTGFTQLRYNRKLWMEV